LPRKLGQITPPMSASNDPVETLADPNVPLTPDQQAKLESMSMIGRPVTFKNKGKPGSWTVGIVEDEVSIIVWEYKHLIQRIKFAEGVSWDGSTHAYRTAYYTYQAGRAYIKWGQYTQFLTEGEYRELLGKARDKGWDIF
jgi:hypothetical protein